MPLALAFTGAGGKTRRELQRRRKHKARRRARDFVFIGRGSIHGGRAEHKPNHVKNQIFLWITGQFHFGNSRDFQDRGPIAYAATALLYGECSVKEVVHKKSGAMAAPEVFVDARLVTGRSRQRHQSRMRFAGWCLQRRGSVSGPSGP